MVTCSLLKLLKCLCAPQVVPHTDKLWDLQLVLPPPDLLLLILEESKSQCVSVVASIQSVPSVQQTRLHL